MPDAAGSAPHRVRRLRWQARAPSAAEAFALRRVLHEGSEAVHTALEQACAAALREAPDAGEVWQVPRLLLRIDAADLGRLKAELPGRVALALRDALAAAGVGGPAAAGALTSARSSALASASATTPAAGAPTRAVARSSAAHERAGLQHYLATGGLNWALAGLAVDAAQPVLQRAAVQALHALWAGELCLDDLLPGPADAVTDRIGALLRWLHLLPAALRQRWMTTSPAPTGINAALREAWRAVIDAAPSSSTTATPTSLEWQALWLACGALPAPAGPLPLAAQLATAPALRAWITRQAAASPASASATAPPNLAQALLRALGPSPNSPLNEPPRRPPLPGKPVDLPSGSADVAATLLVPLAGLVLLHPFLPRFLAASGVLDDTGRAIADPQLPRACALLHGLACGDGGHHEAFEHQLPLVKLLLGQAPDAPLSAALPRLDPAERAEVDALLAAVRAHWTGLRGTGVDGLRLSFLQRRGLLRRADGAWQLTMQAEAFDLLLGLLPWSISLIKLPWMPQPLMVDWPSSS